MRQDVLALTRRAFEQDQVPQLLKGEAPYAIAPDRFLPAAPPTDWSALLREGVLPYCAQDETGERWETLRAAICALIEGNALEVWCAYNVYFSLCYRATRRGCGGTSGTRTRPWSGAGTGGCCGDERAVCGAAGAAGDPRRAHPHGAAGCPCRGPIFGYIPGSGAGDPAWSRRDAGGAGAGGGRAPGTGGSFEHRSGQRQHRQQSRQQHHRPHPGRGRRAGVVRGTRV